ncbi:MAG: hypothetical protein U0325_06605 [Polyangiales bacterium]
MHRSAVGVTLLGLLMACASPPAPPDDRPQDQACPEEPADPMARAACVLRTAGVDATVLRHDDPASASLLASVPGFSSRAAESFAVVIRGGRAAVIGRDAVGAMYGAQELVERARREGAAWRATDAVIQRSPAVPLRAANLFLTLPQADEPSWWLRDRAFWRAYLDLLAAARINVLDLHGMYNPQNTLFPNALLYFATSASMPGVGVPPEARAQNLAALRDLVAMASRRGIRVVWMTYRSDTSLDGSSPAQVTDDAAVERYTTEATEHLARSVPGLWRIGFRVGESGHDAAWYARTFLPGLRRAGTGIGVATRTWGTNPEGVGVVLRETGDDLLLEAKFNGEHLGAPYPVAGGHWAGAWAAYSHEGYLDPPPRYRFVFQVRAGGTHRAFRQLSYAQARRAVATTVLGGAAGFTYEAAHAYMPQRSFLHADPADRFSAWTFRRDELAYLLWGRLGYDLDTPAAVFQDALARRVGTDALWGPAQAASEVVPWITQGFLCGPDHRDAAPELEWGGEVSYLATTARQTVVRPRACAGYHGPIDPFAVASADETADDLAQGRATARLSMGEVANLLLDAAAAARRAADVRVDPANPEARDLARECVALADLGAYYAHKLRAATALGVFQRVGEGAWRDAARREAGEAWSAWRALAAHTAYIAPFDEPLRMSLLGLRQFHWSRQVPWMDDDARDLDAALAAVRATPGAPPWVPAPEAWFARRRPEPPAVRAWTRTGATLEAETATALPAGTRASLYWKPLSARSDWQRVEAVIDGARVRATVDAPGVVLTALELTYADGTAVRTPDVRRETPWAVVPR